MPPLTFLAAPADTPGAREIYDEDLADHGYVMNLSRLWAHQPGIQSDLSGLMARQVEILGLDMRQRGILVAACAATLGDSYCALAWGARLAAAADDATAVGVLRGTDEGLSDRERAMAGWARAVARDPNRTSAADVQGLRDVGFSDPEIFALTVFVALRLAFSTVNDALGARPDAQYATGAPPGVRAAVTFGRPLAEPVED